MARVTVQDAVEVVGNRFDLILLATERARDLANGTKEPKVDWDNDKPTVVALREIEEMEEGKELNEMDEMEMNEGENHPYENGVKVNVSKGGENAPFEKKGKETVKEVVAVDEKLNESKLKRAYKKLLKENQRLKANEKKAVKMLQETMARVEKLATVNSKLAYTTRLFTEHSTTRKEKEAILKKMDKANTVGECDILFSMLSENLEKRVMKKNPTISKSQLNEAKETTKNKKVIKEERTYIDPENQKVLNHMFYKPQA